MNNSIVLEGIVSSDPKEIYTTKHGTFYGFKLKSTRLSGIDDFIDVVVYENIFKAMPFSEGSTIKIIGEVRSFNENRKLNVFVFAKILEAIDKKSAYINEVSLEGINTKKVEVRRTPNTDRYISDLIISIPRTHGRRSFIPIIVWGHYTLVAGDCEIGDTVIVKGRLQSRIYTKEVVEGEFVERVTYEVSCKTFEIKA